MTLVWRGAGIVVPVIFIATAFIISRWEENSMKGIWQSCLAAGILLAVIGAFTLPGKVMDRGTGQMVSKKKHDFFFLPIIVWGILLTAAGVYMLFF